MVPYEFLRCLFYICEICHGCFNRDCIEFVNHFGYYAILIMLILPIHEHGTCFHLFMSSLISFFSVVYFSRYRSFTSLVRFIHRYFIFLVALSNGIFFLISVSAVLLLVYRNDWVKREFHFKLLKDIPYCFPQ